MPPDAFFPAALNDAMAVWKATAAQHDPRKIAIFGSSAGGALTLEMVLRAKQEGSPLPAAIAPGTPMADTTKVGDTFYTSALVDNVLVSPDGICDAATRFYAHNGHSLSDPLLSPVYGDMHGFPPAILTSGTRDLLLRNTVRVHRKPREAGVEASLQVYEGQSHAQYGRDDTGRQRPARRSKRSPRSSTGIWRKRRNVQGERPLKTGELGKLVLPVRKRRAWLPD